MKIKVYKSIGDPQPQVLDVGVLVVEGMHGQPVVVAADLGNGVISAEVAKPDTQDAFNRTLMSLGIDRLVIVDDMNKDLVPMNRQHEMPSILGG
jgi:hypothetical protein